MTVGRVLGIVAGIGFTTMLICCGVLGGLAYVGSRPTGWQEVTFHGYSIKMPGGEMLRENSTQRPGEVIHELSYRRRETGSQYILTVTDITVRGLDDLTIKDLMKFAQVTLGNERTVQRQGVEGLAGTVVAGKNALIGTEAEYFIHRGKIVVVVYAPYSEIKDDIGGKISVRSNERELDDPETFFESLQFP